MLKLKLQYFSHLMRRADLLENTLMLGKIEGKRRRGWQRTRWLIASLTECTWIWASSGRCWRTGKRGVLQSTGHKKTWLRDWTRASNNHIKTKQRKLATFLKSLARVDEENQVQLLPNPSYWFSVTGFGCNLITQQLTTNTSYKVRVWQDWRRNEEISLR